MASKKFGEVVTFRTPTGLQITRRFQRILVRGQTLFMYPWANGKPMSAALMDVLEINGNVLQKEKHAEPL